MQSCYSFFAPIVSSFLLCLQLSPAQNAGEVSLSFVSFPKSTEPVKLKLWLGEGKLIDIEAPSKWLSPPVKVAPLTTWSVGEMANGPDGKPIFKEYGRVEASASSEQIIVVVRKGKDNSDGFALVALDGRTSGFGPGKYLFMNAAKVDAGGVVGGETFVVKPGQHTILKPKVANEQTTFHAALYYRKGDETKPFFGSEWRFDAEARTLIFIFSDPRTDHIKIHSIKNYTP